MASTSHMFASVKDSASVIQWMDTELNASPQAGQFTLFAKLPVEIRLKIWREAQQGPRIVDVLYDDPYFASRIDSNPNDKPDEEPDDESDDEPKDGSDDELNEEQEGPEESTKGLRENQPPPVVLHVCHESRHKTEDSEKILAICQYRAYQGLNYSYAFLDL